ncbi:hypothetical protein [Pacificitalea manganoxidans]|uniref:hypothetical protein n=1 Tax=Pacificitalea manganoxidans TaxID=1411902 RepID=UPI0012FD41BA|nr:hypothetical protein [Pacificitalea manganoxidans]MDR6309056.1 hypothetical protein [Pacificitalea manganoxidans]
MNISSPVTDPVTPLGAAPAILAAANLLLSHLERGQCGRDRGGYRHVGLARPRGP